MDRFNIRLIHYDPIGYGDSASQVAPCFSLDIFLTELEDLVSHIDLHRYAVFAFDKGTPLAIRAASRLDGVSHLILFNAYASFPAFDNDAPSPSYREGKYRDPVLYAGMMTSGAIGHETVEEDDRKALTSIFSSVIGGGKTSWFERINIDSDLMDATPDQGAVTCPTIVMHRPGQRFIPRALARNIHEGIDGSEFLDVDGTSIYPFIGRGSEEIVKTLSGFIFGSRLPTAGSRRPRQDQVINMLSQNPRLTSYAIGRALKISKGAVDQALQRAAQRYGVQGRDEVLKEVRREMAGGRPSSPP